MRRHLVIHRVHHIWRNLHPLLRLFMLALPLAWLGALLTIPPVGVDFFPLYFAAERALAGQSAYGPTATHDLMLVWDAVFARAGVAYPLPLILLVIPFTFLTFPIAAFLWTSLGFAAAYASTALARTHSRLRQEPAWQQALALLVPFTFWPFFRAVGASQATLLWFGLAVVMVLAIRHKRAWLVAICIVLLLLKPQNGLIFALYGAWWLFRHQQRALAFSAILGTLLLALSLLLQPTWINAWLDQVALYREIVQPAGLTNLVVIVLFLAWRLRMPWWGKIAIVQVVLFPLSDVYSTLPLLLTWAAFSPLLAVVGTSVTWLWHFAHIPMTIGSIWAFILIPLMVTALWEARPNELRRHPHTRPQPQVVSVPAQEA